MRQRGDESCDLAVDICVLLCSSHDWYITKSRHVRSVNWKRISVLSIIVRAHVLWLFLFRPTLFEIFLSGWNTRTQTIPFGFLMYIAFTTPLNEQRLSTIVILWWTSRKLEGLSDSVSGSILFPLFGKEGHAQRNLKGEAKFPVLFTSGKKRTQIVLSISLSRALSI